MGAAGAGKPVIIDCREAWEMLRSIPEAVLIDVRCEPEWDFVGVPLVGRLIQAEWRSWPDMRVNPDFLEEISAAGLRPDQPLLLLCKSGVRSLEAAEFLIENGYERVYNVRDGFEGERDANGRRRCVNGWIAAGLPWMQC